jgi:hypothetical protein
MDVQNDFQKSRRAAETPKMAAIKRGSRNTKTYDIKL